MIDSSAITGPACWHGDELKTSTEWQFHLDDADRAEIHAAVETTRQVPIHALNSTLFSLPRLAPRLTRLHHDLIEGRGFVLIRGMPVSSMDREEIIRAYVGVATYLGTAVSQNGKGHLVGHVRDLGNDPSDPATRVYTTTWRQPFHTDSCDIVGLLCLQPAKSGGASAIASSTSVVAEMYRTRPDLLEVMMQPFVYDRKNEIPEGEQPTYQMPVVHYHQKKVSVFYARDFIEAALVRFPEIAQLSEIQREALDYFDSLSRSDRFRLDMDFRQGDIQFLHNHQILHARTTYEDHEEPELKRHLIRLWLSANNPRVLPDVYQRRYGPIVDGEIRGGIRVPGVSPVTPLNPE